MSKLLLLINVATLMAASSLSAADENLVATSGQPSVGEDSVLYRGVEIRPSDPTLFDEQSEQCRDRISQAREASGGAPEFKREPASPEKPYAIYAVHREQDGCSVMVMMGNRNDIRPLPTPMEGPSRIIPADAGE